MKSKLGRKVLSAITVISMMASAIPFAAVAEESTATKVELSYADKYGVVIKGLEGSLVSGDDSISIYDLSTNEAVEVTGGSSTGDSMFVEADLDVDKPYMVTVKGNRTIGDTTYTGSDYSQVFKVKTVLNVEPTIASLDQLSKGIAATNNQVVQGDGVVYLFKKYLSTPSYDNATYEVKLGLYSDNATGGPYFENFFNYNWSAANSGHYHSGGFKYYIDQKNSFLVYAADTTGNQVVHGWRYTPNWDMGVYGVSNNAWNGQIVTESTPHTERIVVAGDAYRMYVNDKKLFDYSNNVMNESGCMRINGSSKGLYAFYGMTVTQMELVESVDTVTLSYADKYGVIIDGLSGSLATGDDSIEIYDMTNNQTVAIRGSSTNGNGMLVEADLDVDKPYMVTVKGNRIIGDTTYTGSDYSQVFKVKTVLNVEPTIASLDQLSKGIAATNNQVVQGDGVVYLFKKYLSTPSYDNATYEVKLGLYSDNANGAPYFENFFNYNWNATSNGHYHTGAFKYYVDQRNSFVVYAADTTGKQLMTGWRYTPNWDMGVYGVSGSAWNGQIVTEATPHTERIVTAGNTYKMYVNDKQLFSYTNDSMNASGCMRINGSSKGLYAFYGMTVTQMELVETVGNVGLSYADRYGVVIEGLEGSLADGDDSIVIYDINAKQNVVITGSSSTDDGMFLEANLEVDKPYKVTVKGNRTIGESIYAGSEYSEVFTVKTVLNVEPTIASLDQLSKGIAATNNQVVQGDGVVYLYKKYLSTPSYDNATFEVKLGLYTDNVNSAPYFENFFNYNWGSSDSGHYHSGGFKYYVDQKNSFLVYAADTTGKQLMTGWRYTPDWDVGVYGVSSGTAWNGQIPEEVTPHTERIVTVGNTYKMYVNNKNLFTYTNDAMNESGCMRINGSAKGLYAFYGMTVTQMELVDKIEIAVTDISADANEIKVSFDKNVEGADDFSKVTVLKNNSPVGFSGITDGKELIIMPDEGIISDAVYSVTVGAGFGPSDVCYTQNAASKNFKVTVYANADFEEGEDADVKADGIVDYKDGAVIFTNGALVIDNADLAEATSYTVKYDYKHYAALEAGGQYNIDTPASVLWFNAPDNGSVIPETGAYWSFGADAVVPMVNGTAVENAGVAASGTKYGDAIVDGNDIIILETGAKIEDYEICIDDEVITETLREVESYNYCVEKNGAGASLLRNGNLIHSFAGTEAAGMPKNGYMGIKASAADVIVIDNLQVYSFEEVESIALSIDEENGKVIVLNYGDEAVEMVIVVAAYTNSNGMISSFKSETITAGVGMTEVEYTLEDTTNAATYKAFAWDSLTELTPYCKAAIYEVE